jgi:hypothetical protein
MLSGSCKKAQADEDTFLDEAIKLAAAEKKVLKAAAEKEKRTKKAMKKKRCDHVSGMSGMHIVEDFLRAFGDGFNETPADLDLAHSLNAGFDVTIKKFRYVWDDSVMLEKVIAHNLHSGVQWILQGKDESARACAVFVIFFEQTLAMTHNTQAVRSIQKLFEMQECDKHTLISFFRKRINCSCLDDRYKQVKSITKMGMCCNKMCSHPNRMVDRSKMLCCT